MAKARIVPPLIPARRISTITGMTPSEHTGSSIPMTQALNNADSLGPAKHLTQSFRSR